MTDALGRTTEQDPTPPRPTVTTSTTGGITTVAITGGTTQATGYSYNHRGELSGIKDAATGEDWGNTYNLLGQVTANHRPRRRGHDDDLRPGRQPDLRHRRRGNTITYTYDALDRKTGEYDGPSPARPRSSRPGSTTTPTTPSPAMTDPIGQLTTETSYSRQQRLHGAADRVQRLRRVPRPDAHPPRRRRHPGRRATPSPTSTPPLTGLLLHDTYPAHPAAGRCLPRRSPHDYGPGSTCRRHLSAATWPPGITQDTTYTAFSQVAQNEIGDS